MNPSGWFSVIGLGLCGVGSVFVAIEVVNRFREESHRAIDGRCDGSSRVVPTEAYTRWEALRTRYMVIGLVLIILGTASQMVGVFISSA